MTLFLCVQEGENSVLSVLYAPVWTVYDNLQS